MALVLHIVSNVVVLILSALQLAMLVRAVLSWFPIDSNRFIDFLYGITEPFIIPFRLLFEKLNWFQNLPIDVSFMAAYLVLTLLIFLL